MKKKAMRVFKTKGFSKDARKAGISDDELWDAAESLSQGQGDNLGGNVWKKRLNRNEHRSIVVEKVSDSWFFVYLFAKQDRANITAQELEALREQSRVYAGLTGADIDTAISAGKLFEVKGNG